MNTTPVGKYIITNGNARKLYPSKTMFWRFGFHNASAIEGIIEKEGSKIDDIMAEEELLQEVKAANPKLIEL